MKAGFRTILILVLLLALSAVSLCACGQPEERTNKGPVITLSDEDKALLEAFGDDLNVIAPDKFQETVSALTAKDAGKVYQLVGYYEKSGEEHLLTTADGKTSLTLNLLYQELTVGDCYSITGIVSYHAHGDENHILLDVITVESYSAS